MNKNVLLLALAAGIGIADYFLLRKSKAEIIQDILKITSKESKNSQVDFASTLNRMSRQELQDVYIVVSSVKENTSKAVIDKLGPAFKERVRVISTKYNIFT